MFIRLNIEISEHKLIVVKYDVNMNHYLLYCAFKFVYFIPKDKIIKFIKKQIVGNIFRV